jgi:hypothetical protein
MNRTSGHDWVGPVASIFLILSSRRGLVFLGNPAASRRRDGESGGTRPMADALYFEFTGVSAHDYRAVNKILGLDQTPGTGCGR